MTKKVKIKDTTFLIPVRIDSVTRLENILLIINFLLSHFDTSIYILEAAPYNNQLLDKLLPANVSHTFIEDQDPVFHRTKYINHMVRACSTPYLSVWDADVLVSPRQIITSLAQLRENRADFVYPYDKHFLDTTPILRELYIQSQDFELLKKHVGKMTRMNLKESVGGAFLATKKAYIKTGIENEFFYGWGPEDIDRINRWKILGYAYKRIQGPLFHLTHERGQNSSFHSSKQADIKHTEILRIVAMSKRELKDEVNTWEH
jgi:predicted glycosyltransferase involved in capsule biosynthesis